MVIKTELKIPYEIVFTLIFGLIVGYYLFITPQIGIADSADFQRIFTRIGLGRVGETHADKYFNYFNSEYTIIKHPKTPINIGQVGALFSLVLNNLFRNGMYSIFYLSALYFILYLGGFYLFLKNAFSHLKLRQFQKLLFGLLSVLVFSDIMFVSYFNSFYQEALFIIVALYIAAFCIERTINFNFLLIALVILAVSKSQNILFLIFPIYIVFFKFKHLNKFVVLGVFFSSIFFIHFIFKDQAETNKPNLYEAVFLGLMREADSSEQENILMDLNLHEKGYLANVNKMYWRENNELIIQKELFQEFYSEVSQIEIIKAYLLNPKIFFKTSFSGLKLLFNNPAQPQHLGNYSKKHSPNEQKTVVLSLWGTFLNYLAFPIYLCSLILAILIIRNRKTNNAGKLLVVLAFWIPIVYVGTFVAGGINDFVKHNLSIYFMVSVVFLLCCLKIFELGKNKDIN